MDDIVEAPYDENPQRHPLGGTLAFTLQGAVKLEDGYDTPTQIDDDTLERMKARLKRHLVSSE